MRIILFLILYIDRKFKKSIYKDANNTAKENKWTKNMKKREKGWGLKRKIRVQ